jgi:hypothetical protein
VTIGRVPNRTRRQGLFPAISRLVSMVGTQDGAGLRGPLTGTAGGSVTVKVGPNDDTLDVVNNSTGDSTTISVSSGKDTSVQLPNVPPGTIVIIRIGTGPNARHLPVLIIAPGP